MKIIFKKAAAKNSITCIRGDGTSTWMEADSFMILHDLTHYVVETQLEIREGFYGLLDQGLDITDFEKKQKIAPSSIPADGIRTEILVSLLLTELNDASPFSDFNQVCEEIMERYHLNYTRLSEESLTALRNGRDEVIKKWNNLPVGSTFVLNFRSN